MALSREEREKAMPLAEVRAAAAKMVPPLTSNLFYAATFGPLGRIEIYLPELPDDDLFNTEWEEVYEFVERIMRRRKEWRARKLEDMLSHIAPNLAYELSQESGNA